MSTLRSNVRPKKDQSSGVTNKRLIKTLKVIIYTEQIIKIDIHLFEHYMEETDYQDHLFSESVAGFFSG